MLSQMLLDVLTNYLELFRSTRKLTKGCDNKPGFHTQGSVEFVSSHAKTLLSGHFTAGDCLLTE